MRLRTIAITVTLVAVLGTFAAPAGAATGPRGTGHATLTGLTLDVALNTVGQRLELEAVNLHSVATRDATRADEPVDLARGTITPVRTNVVDVDSVLNEILKLRVESTADDPRPDSVSVTGQALNLPGELAREDLAVDRDDLETLINTLNQAGDVGAPVGIGSLFATDLPSDELLADFEADGSNAEFGGAGGLGATTLLGGLVSTSGLDLLEEESWSRAEQAGGAVRAFAMDEATLLDLEDTLAVFGLSLDDLTLDVLVGLAEGLELPASEALNPLGLGDFDTWDAAQEGLEDTRDELEGAVDCGELTDPIDSLLGDIEVPCDTVEGALDEVNDLIDDLVAAVEGVLSGAPLLRVVDVKGEVQAVAAVDETGTALTSASAVGSVGDVQVGGVSFGSVDIDLAQNPIADLQAQWNALEADVEGRIDRVLGTLGDAYTGLVDWQPVPLASEDTGVEGQYATAEAKLSLLKVEINLPGSLPDPVEVVESVTGDDLSGTTTSSSTTTTLLPVPTTVPTILEEISSVRPVGEPLGDVVPLGSTITLEVGTLAASAEHTRDIEITEGGENRTFDSSTGFGDGPIPRTGAATTAVLLFAAVLISGGWLGRRAIVRAAGRA